MPNTQIISWKAEAQELDQADPLKAYHTKFHIPLVNGRECIYFCGNSLGLQPKTVASAVEEELEVWKTLGVKGHFQGESPWFSYHKQFRPPLAHITGAQEEEVVAMNALTVNLHLMLTSFYRPTASRYKIIIEKGAFPSDLFAVVSHLRLHGFNPEEALIEIAPQSGKDTLANEDIVQTIATHANALALVLFPGVQYYTGQVFDMAHITRAAHKAGAIIGLDLAHAVGNVPLQLHDWSVDFAVWCSYKYLNSGPGNAGGAFVHEKHAYNIDRPRLAGWWGHDEASRFDMQGGFQPISGADGWQLSNVNILGMAAHKASLNIIQEAGIENMRRKSIQLTGFLFDLIKEIDPEGKSIQILTPEQAEARGCQLSLFIPQHGQHLFDQLEQAGVVVDWREPNVIRAAPAPLYNTFAEVATFAELLQQGLDTL